MSIVGLAFLVLIATLLVAAACYLAFVHNLVAFTFFALVLALAPIAQIPLAQVSLLLVANLGLWAGLATRRRPLPQPGWVELLVGALVTLSLFPLLAHDLTYDAISDYVRWSAAALVAIPLRALSAAELATTARLFARGVAVAAAAAIGLVVLDPGGSVLRRLASVGWVTDIPATTAETSVGSVVRLVGPYGHPNVAAFILLTGLILTAAFLRRWGRVIAMTLILVALALTFSRAALAAVPVMALVLAVFGRRSERGVTLIGSSLVAGVVLLVAVPETRARILDSFGERDIGASARWDALQSFPGDMAGRWWLGRGFGAPEFVDPMSAGTANLAANAVLHTILRGGVVTGVALTALLLAALVASWRHLRGGGIGGAALGAGVIGLVLLPVMLDVPLVTSVPAVASFSLLLAVLGHPDPFAGIAEDDE